MPIDPVDNRYTENIAIADLGGGATLAQVITAFNTLLAALRKSGIISEG